MIVKNIFSNKYEIIKTDDSSDFYNKICQVSYNKNMVYKNANTANFIKNKIKILYNNQRK